MKVLHIIKGLGRGGAETLLPETLRLHNKQAFEFHYIYFLPWKDQLAETLQQQGGRVTCLRANNNIQILFQWWALRRYLREQRIDVVHAHLPWAGIVGRLLHRFTGIPVIYTEHNKYERYHVLTRWMNKLTFKWQTLVIAVSEDVANSIRTHIRPTVPVRTILNGVATEDFKRQEAMGQEVRKTWGIPPDAVVIGTVAVFREQKRLNEWLEVVAQVMHTHPHVYGLLVGDGPQRGAIEAQRDALGLAQRVIMPGLQIAVRPYYAAMDVFLMTSLFEGLPLALLEAMSMSCAIATTDAGGIKEVVTDGQDGRTVPIERWQDLIPITASLCVDQASRLSLANEARHTVEQRFSLATMVKQLEAVYLQFKR